MRGGRDNFRGRGGRGGYDRGGGNRRYDRGNDGPSSSTAEVGQFQNLCNNTAIYKLTTSNSMVPFTNAFLYDEKDNKVGKVLDVYGPMDNVFFVLQPDDESYLKTLKPGQKIYTAGDKLRPESFFLGDQPPPRRGGRGGGRSRGGGGGRGGSGGGRGGGGRGGGGRGGGRGRGRF